MTREVEHHVQTLPGYSRHVHGLRGKVSQAEYNEQVKRLELQYLKAFTHGTSEQRMSWFQKGYNNGTVQGLNTFNAINL